jgi:hypothetical protein
VLKIVVDGSSRTGHDESGLLGSGDGGAAARRDGEWSACATQWGVETVECGVSQWGLGSEVRCGRWRGRVQQRASEAGDFIHSA